MSRWRNDPAAAAAQLIGRALEAIDVKGRVLLANAAESGLAARLAQRGITCDHWLRRAEEKGALMIARTWPPAGPFDAVLLRLPRAKDEQDMATHAAISVLAPAGKLIVYGGNDEGIRSAAGVIARTCGEVETLAAKGHGRILAARAPRDRANIRGALADWRRTTRLLIAGVARTWVTYPGVFAAGRIDAATSLLLAAMPRLPQRARLLDFGCGSGVIGASALVSAGASAGAAANTSANVPASVPASIPTSIPARVSAPAGGSAIALDMLDNDTVALAAARENVPQGRAILATALAEAPDGYHAILSNPPLHRGSAEDHRLLHELIAQAPSHLTPDGILEIVVQRRLDVGALLAQGFAHVAVAAQSPRFRVWRAQAPRAPRARPCGGGRLARHR
jgi:16S rRNA (guanine1207-N2)-methyltransferase